MLFFFCCVLSGNGFAVTICVQRMETEWKCKRDEIRRQARNIHIVVLCAFKNILFSAFNSKNVILIFFARRQSSYSSRRCQLQILILWFVSIRHFLFSNIHFPNIFVDFFGIFTLFNEIFTHSTHSFCMFFLCRKTSFSEAALLKMTFLRLDDAKL